MICFPELPKLPEFNFNPFVWINASTTPESPPEPETKSLPEVIDEAFLYIQLVYGSLIASTLIGTHLGYLTIDFTVGFILASTLINVITAIAFETIIQSALSHIPSHSSEYSGFFDTISSQKELAKAEKASLLESRKKDERKATIAARDIDALQQAVPVGLHNMGQNCWANALLQLILHSYLREAILAFDLSKTPENTVIDCLQEIILEYEENQKDSNPLSEEASQKLRRQILLNHPGSGLSYDYSKAEDVDEALGIILNLLDEKNMIQKTIRTYEIPITLFGPKTVDGISLPDKEDQFFSMKETKEPPHIKLPMQGIENFKLNEILNVDKHSKIGDSGKYEDVNGIFNEYPLENEDCSFTNTPPALFITAGRFYHDIKMKKSGKIQDKIEVPEKITIDGKNYEICSFAIHHGSSLKGGHYTAYIKKDGRWYHCNDSIVKEVSEMAAKEAMGLFYVAEFKQKKAQ